MLFDQLGASGGVQRLQLAHVLAKVNGPGRKLLPKINRVEL